MKFILCIVLLMGGLGTAVAQQDPIFTKDESFGTLAKRWELDSIHRKGTFIITPYKAMYITAGRWSSNPNEQPFSENPAYSAPAPLTYGKYEAKYLISMKAKVLQQIFWGKADLWMAYTQKSHWQIYNFQFSRPFRETNYEPEVILNFPTNVPVIGGFRNRLLSIILNHQSNGRGLPLSRSWNRVILQAGFEKNNWVVYLRPWYRIPDTDDENPAITDYIGRADATIIHKRGRSLFSLAGSHSLRLGKENRGQIQFDWTYLVKGNFKMNVQFFNGYGETLVDYNHNQSTLGVSVSLIEWL